MRSLKNAGSKLGSSLGMDQYRLTARVDVEQLWDEWEIQLLVIVSFALQVFLLLFSGFRKRTTSSLLRGSVWLAYMLADYVAIFVLGHMALHINGPRHGLVLFWAPFMLLHLGGQETITAFSMEDNMLWKRHLLSLVTQAGLAAYVVGKQWQGDKRLLAPMVLMFVSGTLKYAGRTSALMHAAKQITPGAGISLFAQASPGAGTPNRGWTEEPKSYRYLLWFANLTVHSCLPFLVDKTPLSPPRSGFPIVSYVLGRFLSDDRGVHISYKLAELQLRLVYDYCYTKIGADIGPGDLLNSCFSQLVTLGSTVASLVLFSQADLLNYSTADILVSYILLCGAILLEIVCIFISISSVRRCHHPENPSAKVDEIIFTIVRTVHPESRPQWSQKLAQYNLIGGCIKAKRAGVMRRLMHVAGINHGIWTHAEVSHELKRLFLDKLVVVESWIDEDAWDISKFTGQWAKLELRRKKQEGSPLLRLLAKSTDRPSFVSSILTWHIATDICYFHEGNDDSPSSRTPSWELARELSNYVMFLCAEHGIMSGNDGQSLLENTREFIHASLSSYQESLDDCAAVVRHIFAMTTPHELARLFREQLLVDVVHVEPVLILAHQLVQELRMINASDDRWGIIINVWMEMLCYMSFHCGPDFHIKHLSTGGEFITHVKALIFNLGLPYSMSVPENDEEPSNPGQVSTDSMFTFATATVFAVISSATATVFAVISSAVTTVKRLLRREANRL